MHEAVAAIAGCGVSPVVRIAANEGWMVKSKIRYLCPWGAKYQRVILKEPSILEHMA